MGVARATIVGLRARILTPGDDFAQMPRRGIVYTPAGFQKMRAAIPAGPPDSAPEKNGAPPAPALFALRVVRQSNARTALATIEGREGLHRAFVRVVNDRRGAATLSRGMVLEACTQVNDELFDYAGPVPARLGQPMPERRPS